VKEIDVTNKTDRWFLETFHISYFLWSIILRHKNGS